jgi:hypothetical protein
MLVLPRIPRSGAGDTPHRTSDPAQPVPGVTHGPGHFSTEVRGRASSSHDRGRPPHGLPCAVREIGVSGPDLVGSRSLAKSQAHMKDMKKHEGHEGCADLAAACGGEAVSARPATRQDYEPKTKPKVFAGLVGRGSHTHRARRSRARQVSGCLRSLTGRAFLHGLHVLHDLHVCFCFWQAARNVAKLIRCGRIMQLSGCIFLSPRLVCNQEVA